MRLLGLPPGAGWQRRRDWARPGGAGKGPCDDVRFHRFGVSWLRSLENPGACRNHAPGPERPTDYLAVAEASRGHPCTAHPLTAFFLLARGSSGLTPNSPSFWLRLPYRSRTPDSSWAAKSRPSRTRALTSWVPWRAAATWPSFRSWATRASPRAASSWARQCSNAGRSSRLASTPARRRSQCARIASSVLLESGLDMSPFLSLSLR